MTTSKRIPFDAIAITSASPIQAQAYTLELELRRRLGLISEETLIVAVPDPAGLRVGSGGATLNALAVVSQRLCYMAGYSDVNARFLANKRILILHSGGDSQRIPIFSVRGKAFSSLPSTNPGQQHVNAPIDFLIEKISALFQVPSAPEGGCVVAATDVLLLMPDTYQWHPERKEGVTGIGVSAPKEFGTGHGVYICQPSVMSQSAVYQEPVVNILQKATVAQLTAAGAVRPDGNIIIDSGIIYFSAGATADFLSLHNKTPLDSCTDTGLDGGSTPFRFELYTDILLVMNPGMTRDDYLAMPLPSRDSDSARVLKGRKLLWKLLRKYNFYLMYVSDSHFAHLGTIQEYLAYLNNDSVFKVPFRLEKRARSFIEYPGLCKEGVLINSILAGHGRVEHGALVENSYLRGNFHIERSSVVSGVRSISGLHTTQHMVVQEVQLSGSRVRTDPRVRHLLATQSDRAFQREQPFFVAPTGGDGSRFVDSLHSNGSKDPVLRVIVCFGVFDQIKESYKSKKATLCNRPWTHYFPPSVFDVANPVDPASPLPQASPNSDTAAGASLHSFAHLLLNPDDDDIWPPMVADQSRTLWNARLFPVLVGEQTSESILWLQYAEAPSVQTLCEWKQATRVSLEDILALSDAPQEFYWRARASFLVDQKEMESILLERRDRPLLPIIGRCQPEYKSELLQCLDSIASSGPLDVCARTLCSIADVLASLPETHVFTRGGPARNPQWLNAISLIADARTARQQAGGVAALASQRNVWLKVGSPQLFMRAARHYDGAWASLTRKGVETVKLNSCDSQTMKTAPRVGQIVECTTPVRMDLMGGWSDTPPITFEHGGKVVNVALKVDGEHPIGASAKSFYLPPGSNKVIIIQTGKSRKSTLDEVSTLTDEDDDTVILSKPSDILDYNDPSAPGALVKCVLLAVGLVDLNSSLSLSQQIQNAIHPTALDHSATKDGGVGIYIRSWSTLPQGTGLGVSSILAANIVVAVAAVAGKEFTLHNLMHVVLMVEQMLTTGGGWQDQVGGCYPGFKIAVSGDTLPLLVETHVIKTPANFNEIFNDHILLIHTGQSRLAKNLLQTVLRRWYQRDEVVTNVVDGLVTDAETLRTAIEQGDIIQVGHFVSKYWEYKKTMASPPPTNLKHAKEAPVMPLHIQRLAQRLKPLSHGLTLVGAGGGGYMCVITKDSIVQTRPIIQAIIDQLNAECKAAHSRGVNIDNKDDFADDWPTGDYVLYAASVCTEGLTRTIT